MLIKFETKSNRVKGLSFHPKRPWILASLHSGLIQMWDYRMGTLLDQFDEHEGPVRSVDFHRSQPLFVSGGDDYKIKVWNYKLRRCIFTLQGHLDYIRTVEFHLEQPWIVSSSDDQTIRIWNWQSRTCIAVLTGHNHYVMCASFHPTDDLVVSASLDQTIRVWDISGLKKKNVSSDDFNMKLNQLNQDLFGTNDVMVKYILEGHERGVNWAVFHPTQQLVVSGADDRYVKMWRISDTKAWEIESLTGHGNNVSCVRFHGKKDLVVSNSEDKSIRVWRLSTGQFLTSYKRENDRFWIVAVHPSQNLIAAGHDSGLMIFKLERERPPFTVVKDSLYYIREKYLRKYNLANNSDTPVASIRRTSTNSILNLSYNQQENCILLTSGSGENAAWELFKIPKNSTNDVEVCTQLTKGKGLAAVFTGINKYTYLSNDRSKLIVQNIQTEQSKEITLPVAPVDNIFQAGSGRVLLRSEDKIHLFDFEQQTIIASTAAAGVKFAVWSEDMSRVALVSKHILIIANSKLEPQCSIHETIRIKSGAFDDQGVFIYTTLNHLKYCLPNGDSGTIKTLDLPIYIAKVKSNAIHYIDREGVVGILLIDATEYRFKMALLQGKARDIQSIIGQSKILGDSIIAYLQQKGHPNIAMKFVQDDLTKFDLALECGNIDVAFQAAKKLDDKECWQKLGAEALRQGNYLIVEKAYQQTKEFERLSFLYSISGNVPALQKMLKIAGLRQDTMSKFHNALYLGDAEVRVRILLEAGQNSLAYASAVAHGLTELAEEIKKTLDPQFTPQVPENASLLLPPTPIIRETVWPLLNTFEEADESHAIASAGEADLGEAGWNVEIPGLNENGAVAEQPEEEVAPAAPGEGEGWDFMASEELQNITTSIEQTESSDLLFSAPSPGRSLTEYWPENSTHPADHIAAGSFNTAMHALNQTCGIVNFKPLKDYFLSIFMGATTAVPVSSLPAFTIPLQRQSAKNEDDNKHATLPMLTSTSLAELSARAKSGQDALTAAKFEESQKIFRGILHSLLFTILPSRKEEREAKDLIKICVEYIIATRLELIRKGQYKDIPQKNAELAAYFTRCKIHPSHVMLSLASAMAVCCKPEVSNFLTAAEFAKRLLKMNPSANLAKQANHVIKMAEQKPSNKFDLNYDERNPFVICSLSLSPIYAGSESIKCSYCQAPYLPKYRGELCPVCEVAEIGLNVPGLQPFKSKGSSMLE